MTDEFFFILSISSEPFYKIKKGHLIIQAPLLAYFTSVNPPVKLLQGIRVGSHLVDLTLSGT
ncbi:MAG: hypothetical protein J6I64_00055, partial [Lachnospiraceae bacterium]|nr:hypothetical protein [Lachnospiraceae bacterium]